MKFHFKHVITFLFLLVVPTSYANKPLKVVLSTQEDSTIYTVRNFIKSNWQNTIRVNKEDSGNLYGLPKPYTIPTMKEYFQEMYYWDSYFTNQGLIHDGNVEQAKNNCENVLFMVERLGYMPNGNRTFYLHRSQPPYLSMMIRDVYEQTMDQKWLKKCLPTLEKEYNYWMTKHATPIGLNRYTNSNSAQEKLEAYYDLAPRLGKNYNIDGPKTDEERRIIGSHFIAEAESGWDFNPRFERRCEDFCPVDLNANLYLYEQNFAYFYKILNEDNPSKWIKLAEKRKSLMNKYLVNKKNKLFYDYDFVNNKLSPIYSAAVFNLLWAKVLTPCQAKVLVKNLNKLEMEHGISTCEPGARDYVYQWDYPNGWPCLQFLALTGLQNYKYEKEAVRIAHKYITTVGENFIKTKNLWEKYNIVDGTTNAQNEYEMPAMMGWTAGVYVYFVDYLKGE